MHIRLQCRHVFHNYRSQLARHGPMNHVILKATRQFFYTHDTFDRSTFCPTHHVIYTSSHQPCTLNEANPWLLHAINHVAEARHKSLFVNIMWPMPGDMFISSIVSISWKHISTTPSDDMIGSSLRRKSINQESTYLFFVGKSFF